MKFVLFKFYHFVRLFIAKNCIFLSRIPFVYWVFQRFFRIPKLKAFLKYINNTSGYYIRSKFNNYKTEVIQLFEGLKNKKELYILFPFPSIGEYALSFILLRNFLSSYKGNINIICPENTVDIAKIFGMYFRINKYIIIPSYLGYCNIDVIKQYLGIDVDINMGDFLCKIRSAHEISLKDGECRGFLFGYYDVSNELVSKTNFRKIAYKYDKIDKIKIGNILDLYNNKKGLFICNFESKSLKSCIDDLIQFSDYISKIAEIAKKNHLKFVVNSVYNNEKLFNDENILITRLNFQEIIWLSEHEKIKLFISERNGLNDVFKVFYPEINQIIYYPDYYWGNVSKKYSKKLNKQYNLINIYSLKSDNVCELIRGKFNSTIEQKIKILGIG